MISKGLACATSCSSNLQSGGSGGEWDMKVTIRELEVHHYFCVSIIGRYLERTLVDKGPSFETLIITIVVSGFLHDFDIFGFVGVQAL